MRKDDIILCLLLAALAAGFYYFNNAQGQMVTISVNGTVVLHKPLAELPPNFSIAADLGTLHLHTDGKSIAVTDAPCPDKLCQKQGAITGGSLVCVPCRTIITLTDSVNENDYDAILK